MLIVYLFNNYKTITKKEKNIYNRVIKRYLITSLQMFVINISDLLAIFTLYLFYKFKNLNYLIHY